jgi:uncharacterized membrane protein
MDIKRFAVSVLVGAFAMHAIGYLVFDVATADFYAANAARTDLTRDSNLQWSIALGNLSFATLLALYIARADRPSVAGGMLAGAVVGFLAWSGADFTFHGYEDRWNLILTITDPMLAAIQMAIAGAVIAGTQARIAATSKAQGAA